jgi:hypothetical protein
VALYSYYCTDLVTQRILGLFPLTGVSYQTTLDAAGTFSADLSIADPAIRDANWEQATRVPRTALYVLRDVDPVWGGIIWTRDYDSTSMKEHFQAATFESYWSHLPYNASTSWVNKDQMGIVREILASVAAAGYVMPCPVSGNTSGILRDFATDGTQYQWILSIIQQLQQLPDGFDFAVDVFYNALMGPYKQLNLDYPRRGLTAVETPYVFEYPGNVISYKWPEDGSAFATDVVEMGAGSGPSMVVGLAADVGLVVDGWPIMFAVVSRKNEDRQAFIDGYAAGDLAIYRVPTTIVELHVRAGWDPRLGTYRVGDDVRLRIGPNREREPDSRFPLGLDTFLRIQSIKVVVGDDGNEDVAITLIPTAT